MARRAELVGNADRFLRRIVGQAEDDQIDLRHHVAARGRILALVLSDTLDVDVALPIKPLTVQASRYRRAIDKHCWSAHRVTA